MAISYSLMDNIISVKCLDMWFVERLQDLHYKPETIAYVAGVMKTLARPGNKDDLSKRSIVLAYQNATLNGDFVEFQRIGDWVLWSDIIVPDSLNGTREAIETIGRNSYYACHRIMRRQWYVYEELSDTLPILAYNVRNAIRVATTQDWEKHKSIICSDT